MRSFPLPAQITKDRFYGFITDLYQELVAKGLDPSSHLVIGNDDSLDDDGRIVSRFSLFISETAAQILNPESGARKASADGPP